MRLPVSTTSAEVSFAEINVPTSVPIKLAADDNAVAAIHAKGITLEVSNDISAPLLKALLQEVLHAW